MKAAESFRGTENERDAVSGNSFSLGRSQIPCQQGSLWNSLLEIQFQARKKHRVGNIMQAE
jgi:hypothetical protein